MTAGNKMRSRVRRALQYLIRSYIGIENVGAVRMARGVRKLPKFARAAIRVLMRYDNDVTPGTNLTVPL